MGSHKDWTIDWQKSTNKVFEEQAVEKQETHKQNLARCVASKIQSLQKAQVIY